MRKKRKKRKGEKDLSNEDGHHAKRDANLWLGQQSHLFIYVVKTCGKDENLWLGQQSHLCIYYLLNIYVFWFTVYFHTNFPLRLLAAAYADVVRKHKIKGERKESEEEGEGEGERDLNMAIAWEEERVWRADTHSELCVCVWVSVCVY